jgi:hypothetical protein
LSDVNAHCRRRVDGSIAGGRGSRHLSNDDNVRDHRGGEMKIATLALVAASAVSLSMAPRAWAAPADGAAIAGIEQTVDPAIAVATNKKSASRATAAKPACPADQTRSNRTGNCRPLTSEER